LLDPALITLSSTSEMQLRSHWSEDPLRRGGYEIERLWDMLRGLGGHSVFFTAELQQVYAPLIYRIVHAPRWGAIPLELIWVLISPRATSYKLGWAPQPPRHGWQLLLGRVWGTYVHAMRRSDVRSSVHFAGRAILLNSRNSIQTTLWLLWLAMKFFPPFAFFAYCSIYVNKFIKKAHWQ